MLRASWLNIWGFEDIIRFGFGYRLLRRCRFEPQAIIMLWFINFSTLLVVGFGFWSFWSSSNIPIFYLACWGFTKLTGQPNSAKFFLMISDFCKLSVFFDQCTCWHAIMFNNMRVDLGLKHKPWSIIDLWISLWHSFGPNFA